MRTTTTRYGARGLRLFRLDTAVSGEEVVVVAFGVDTWVVTVVTSPWNPPHAAAPLSVRGFSPLANWDIDEAQDIMMDSLKKDLCLS